MAGITESARNMTSGALESARNMAGSATESVRSGARSAMEAARNADHSEGSLARSIEQQTAKLPSDTFLWAALGSIGLSLGLQMAGKRDMSNFVGQWAPTFLILGLYNKLVKLHGSDTEHPY